MSRPAPAWMELLPSWRTGVAVVLLFAVAALLAREARPWIEAEGTRHVVLGMVLLFGATVVAVLAPMATRSASSSASSGC